MSFEGSITTTGKSEAIRIEKALFRSHPEFRQQAKVRATVIAEGTLLVSLLESDIAPSDEDPVMSAFLGFLEKDLQKHPERPRALSSDTMKRARKLTRGVPIRDSESLPEKITF